MSEEEIEYIKHCLEHFECLTGGTGHSKTKQIIEQLQQEKQQLEERINNAIEYMKHYIKVEECNQPVKIEFGEVIKILDKAGDINEKKN